MPKKPIAALLSLLLSAACAPASAPVTVPTAPLVGTTGDAKAVLARSKAATGGAGWDALVASRSEGTLTASGLTGPIAIVEDARTGRSVTRYTLGPVQGAQGFDGVRSWEQDPGGEITIHDAPDAREDAVTDAWLAARGFYRPDQGGARLTPPRTETDGGVSYLVIDATPPGGRSVALWFDARSLVLARMVARRGAKTTTTSFGDQRVVGGVMIPFHTTQDTADEHGQVDPRTHSDVALRTVTWSASLDDATFAMPAMTPSARIDDPSGVTRVPFQLVNNHIYVEGSVDGKRARFIVDTGGVNLLTPASAARLGLSSVGKMTTSGAGEGTAEVGLARAKEVRVGAATLAKPVFYVIDLGAVRAIEGEDLDGLVGYELFRRFRVTIDYAARTLTLADPARSSPPAGAHVVPFDMAERIPIINATLDGIPLRISIDTGARNALTIHTPFSSGHDLATKYAAAPETVVGWGVGGASHGRPVRLGTLALGDLRLRDIAGDLCTDTKGSCANPEVHANLGGGILSRFTVGFDYAARRMYLTPNASIDGPYSVDRSGTWIVADGDALKVAAVATGGPAEKAGLKVGDRILSIGGEAVSTHLVSDWRARLRDQPAGTRLLLRVAAPNDAKAPREVKLILADPIPAHSPPGALVPVGSAAPR